MLAMRRNLTPLPGAAAVLLAAPADLLCLPWINRTVRLLKTGAFESLSGTTCDHSFHLIVTDTRSPLPPPVEHFEPLTCLSVHFVSRRAMSQ